MKQDCNFPNSKSQQEKGASSNSQISQKKDSNNIQSFQNYSNKMIAKPIGIYNFNSNKSDISSLQGRIDEVVSSFIEQNKENIMKYVMNEVQIKLNEKIEPVNSEISNIKNNFNSLYDNEVKDFKELDILNECHNNILNINNKFSIMNENINKYNDEIKGFNVADNRLQFLNKLNKNLEEFIIEINNENERNMNMDIDEENQKIDEEQKKQENINQELDNIFNETISLLKIIYTGEKNNNLEQFNNFDISNNLKNTINDFELKFDYNNPKFEKQKDNKNECNNYCINKKYDSNKNNVFDSIPDFFDFHF